MSLKCISVRLFEHLPHFCLIYGSILLSFIQVEINNTDAEGRLVLGDGVALASKSSKNNGDDNSDRLPGPPVNLIVDMATLTGAQLVTTGKTVAAVMSNGEEAEKMAVAAGRHSGDLLFPVMSRIEHLWEHHGRMNDSARSKRGYAINFVRSVRFFL